MREPSTKVIGGRTYTVTPLPAMKALRLMPLGAKGLTAMSSDEIDRYARELLFNALVDDRPLLPSIDSEMQGRMTDLLELLAFAGEVNYGNPTGAVG